MDAHRSRHTVSRSKLGDPTLQAEDGLSLPGVRVRREPESRPPIRLRVLRRLADWLKPLWLRHGPAIAVVHVPKTAGTAYSAALRDGLAPLRVVTGFDRSTFGGFDDFTSMSRQERRQIYLRPGDLPRNAAFIGGHFAVSTIRAAAPRAGCVMLLREPVCRVLSQWAYWRSRSDAELAALGTWAERVRLARLPLADFLAHPLTACQTDNVYVRALLWPDRRIPPDGFIAPEHEAALLAEAETVLDGLGFTGIVEDAGMAAALGRWAGCRIAVPVVNVTEHMPPAMRTAIETELGGETAGLLEARSRLDLALWRRVAARSLSPGQIDALREQTLAATRARYARLLSA